jgi:pimeloyl-ACP methyl ester carboxylesterase
MHRSSLPGRPLGLLLGLALLAVPQWSGSARAADKFTKVTFDTVDGVTLQGTFYPSAKGKDEPTVLLLHKLGTSDSHKDGWDALAAALNEKGYSVLSFDFRGHGNSTTVDPKTFWSPVYGWNAKLIKGGSLDAKGKPRDTIDQKHFPPAYVPYLLNDIAAAKWFLDERNDAGECNSRSLILIGAEDGAALGALWMLAEWNRFGATIDRLRPGLPPLVRSVEKEPEGKDQYCAIWLTMMPLRSVSIPLKIPLRQVGREKKVPMGFFYGDGDSLGKEHAKDFVKLIKGEDTESPKYQFTLERAIKEGKELKGSQLLRKTLGTQDDILTYLEKVRDKNPPHKWSKVEAAGNAYVWTFPGAPMRAAKEEKGKALEPIPLAALGLQP